MSLLDRFPNIGDVNLALIKDIYDIVHDGIDANDIKKIVAFLDRYGYITSLKEMTVEEVIQAVKKLRKTYKLTNNEGIDGQLLKAIDMPRCGVPDILPARATAGRWNKRDLKVYISKYLSEFTQAQTQKFFQEAFDSWTQYTKELNTIKIVNSPNGADIIIGTGRGRRDGFDGQNGTLAYAYLPPGDDRQLGAMFDEDEIWSPGPPTRGIYIVPVSAHEFGHLLGLDHDTDSAVALMDPIYNPAIGKPQPNDVKRIQAIYGVKDSGSVSPTPETLNIKINGVVSNIDIPGYRITKLG